MRRVAITGAGTVNALGSDVASTFDAFRSGRSAIGPLSVPDMDRLTVRIGAQVRGFDEINHLSPRQLSLCDRVSAFALVAARQAAAQAGVGPGSIDPIRAGVVLGTAGGGLASSEDAYRAVFERRAARVHPFIVPRLMASAPTSHISMELGLCGPSFTLSTACAASNHALGLAFQTIRAGAADVMFAGGTEAMLTFGGIKAWEGLRVLSPTGCRPFCATRDGMVMGEGAAVFVLEEMARARARGAPILAEIRGFGMSADAQDIVLPSQAGAEAAMRAALKDAGLQIEGIDYINAHGTGTLANDKTEAAAIQALFGARSDRPAVSSTKSLHGHLIGATGAVELLAVILALGEGTIAPTAGVQQPDTSCDIDLVHGAAQQRPVRAALSNGFAFGGLNAVLALSRA